MRPPINISRCRIISDFVDAFDVNFFMAGGIPEYISIAPGTVMKYNHTQLNLRNGYNSSTGTDNFTSLTLCKMILIPT